MGVYADQAPVDTKTISGLHAGAGRIVRLDCIRMQNVFEERRQP